MHASSKYVINLGREPSLVKLLDLYILYFTSASGCVREFGFGFHEYLKLNDEDNRMRGSDFGKMHSFSKYIINIIQYSNR